MKNLILLIIINLFSVLGIQAQESKTYVIELDSTQKIAFCDSTTFENCNVISQDSDGYWVKYNENTYSFIEKSYFSEIDVQPIVCTAKPQELQTPDFQEKQDSLIPEKLITRYSTDCEGYEVLLKFLGETEVKGTDYNYNIDFIVRHALDLTDLKLSKSQVNDDVIFWCSAAMLYAENVCNRESLDGINLMAKSWLQYGRSTTDLREAVLGDIVVFWRESPYSWKGHVGYFFGFNYDRTKVLILGGNQNNQISLSYYSVNQIVAIQKVN